MKQKLDISIPRRERKKAATREHIVKVAMDLFKKEGIAATTMEQIAEVADIAKGTLYNYFPEKDAIVAANTEAVIADFTQGLRQQINFTHNGRQSIQSIFEHFLKKGLQHKAHFKTYIAYRMSQMVNQKKSTGFVSSLEEVLCQIIHAAQVRGEIRPELPAQGLAHNLEITLLMHCLRQIQQDSVQLDISDAVDLFFQGAGKAYRPAEE